MDITQEKKQNQIIKDIFGILAIALIAIVTLFGGMFVNIDIIDPCNGGVYDEYGKINWLFFIITCIVAFALLVSIIFFSNKNRVIAWGTRVLAAIFILSFTCRLFWGSNDGYFKPDANHYMPVIIYWIIDFAGIGCIFLVPIKNRITMWVTRILAAIAILFFTFVWTSKERYYHYDKDNSCWVEKNVYGKTYETRNSFHSVTFGDVLIIRGNEMADKSFRNSFVYYRPYIYLPDRKIEMESFVEVPLIDNIANYVSTSDGIYDCHFNKTIKSTDYNSLKCANYKYIIAEGDNGKYGLLNYMGDTIIPLIHNDIYINHWDGDYYRGCLALAIDNNWIVIDTLGNVMSAKEYKTKYSNEYPFLEIDLDERSSFVIESAKLEIDEVED